MSQGRLLPLPEGSTDRSDDLSYGGGRRDGRAKGFGQVGELPRHVDKAISTSGTEQKGRVLLHAFLHTKAYIMKIVHDQKDFVITAASGVLRSGTYTP